MKSIIVCLNETQRVTGVNVEDYDLTQWESLCRVIDLYKIAIDLGMEDCLWSVKGCDWFRCGRLVLICEKL